jgi:hypothetical protein
LPLLAVVHSADGTPVQAEGPKAVSWFCSATPGPRAQADEPTALL